MEYGVLENKRGEYRKERSRTGLKIRVWKRQSGKM